MLKSLNKLKAIQIKNANIGFHDNDLKITRDDDLDNVKVEMSESTAFKIIDPNSDHPIIKAIPSINIERIKERSIKIQPATTEQIQNRSLIKDVIQKDTTVYTSGLNLGDMIQQVASISPYYVLTMTPTNIHEIHALLQASKAALPLFNLKIYNESEEETRNNITNSIVGNGQDFITMIGYKVNTLSQNIMNFNVECVKILPSKYSEQMRIRPIRSIKKTQLVYLDSAVSNVYKMKTDEYIFSPLKIGTFTIHDIFERMPARFTRGTINTIFLDLFNDKKNSMIPYIQKIINEFTCDSGTPLDFFTRYNELIRLMSNNIQNMIRDRHTFPKILRDGLSDIDTNYSRLLLYGEGSKSNYSPLYLEFISKHLYIHPNTDIAMIETIDEFFKPKYIDSKGAFKAAINVNLHSRGIISQKEKRGDTFISEIATALIILEELTFCADGVSNTILEDKVNPEILDMINISTSSIGIKTKFETRNKSKAARLFNPTNMNIMILFQKVMNIGYSAAKNLLTGDEHSLLGLSISKGGYLSVFNYKNKKYHWFNYSDNIFLWLNNRFYSWDVSRCDGNEDWVVQSTPVHYLIDTLVKDKYERIAMKYLADKFFGPQGHRNALLSLSRTIAVELDVPYLPSGVSGTAYINHQFTGFFMFLLDKMDAHLCNDFGTLTPEAEELAKLYGIHLKLESSVDFNDDYKKGDILPMDLLGFDLYVVNQASELYIPVLKKERLIRSLVFIDTVGSDPSVKQMVSFMKFKQLYNMGGWLYPELVPQITDYVIKAYVSLKLKDIEGIYSNFDTLLEFLEGMNSNLSAVNSELATAFPLSIVEIVHLFCLPQHVEVILDNIKKDFPITLYSASFPTINHDYMTFITKLGGAYYYERVRQKIKDDLTKYQIGFELKKTEITTLDEDDKNAVLNITIPSHIQNVVESTTTPAYFEYLTKKYTQYCKNKNLSVSMNSMATYLFNKVQKYETTSYSHIETRFSSEVINDAILNRINLSNLFKAYVEYDPKSPITFNVFGASVRDFIYDPKYVKNGVTPQITINLPYPLFFQKSAHKEVSKFKNIFFKALFDHLLSHTFSYGPEGKKLNSYYFCEIVAKFVSPTISPSAPNNLVSQFLFANVQAIRIQYFPGYTNVKDAVDLAMFLNMGHERFKAVELVKLYNKGLIGIKPIAAILGIPVPYMSFAPKLRIEMKKKYGFIPFDALKAIGLIKNFSNSAMREISSHNARHIQDVLFLFLSNDLCLRIIAWEILRHMFEATPYKNTFLYLHLLKEVRITFKDKIKLCKFEVKPFLEMYTAPLDNYKAGEHDDETFFPSIVVNDNPIGDLDFWMYTDENDRMGIQGKYSCACTDLILNRAVEYCIFFSFHYIKDGRFCPKHHEQPLFSKIFENLTGDINLRTTIKTDILRENTCLKCIQDQIFKVYYDVEEDTNALSTYRSNSQYEGRENYILGRDDFITQIVRMSIEDFTDSGFRAPFNIRVYIEEYTDSHHGLLINAYGFPDFRIFFDLNYGNLIGELNALVSESNGNTPSNSEDITVENDDGDDISTYNSLNFS